MTFLRGGATATLLLTLFLSLPSGLVAQADEVDSILRKVCNDSVADQVSALQGRVEIPEKEIGYFRETLVMLREAGYSDGLCVEFVGLASGLVRAGISLKDLASKVREGIAKGASTERVRAVIRDRTERLKSARVVVLSLENDGVSFLDKQMAYRVMADYLTRGVSAEEMSHRILDGRLSEYPALSNIIR